MIDTRGPGEKWYQTSLPPSIMNTKEPTTLSSWTVDQVRTGLLNTSTSGKGQAFYIQFGTLRELPESSHPCLNKFINLLDAHQPFDVAPSAIGGPFVNISTLLSLSVPCSWTFCLPFLMKLPSTSVHSSF